MNLNHFKMMISEGMTQVGITDAQKITELHSKFQHEELMARIHTAE
jgi:hypothetical protein